MAGPRDFSKGGGSRGNGGAGGGGRGPARFPRSGGAPRPPFPRGGGQGGGMPPPRRRPRPPKSLRIIHEDDDVLIVDKPPGIITAHLMPPGDAPYSPPPTESLFDMVKDHIRASRRRRGQSRVWIIHRLDKEASGLLVFAKNEKAYTWLKEDFRAKRVHRLYMAVVEGAFEEQQGAEGAAGEAQQGRRVKQLPAGTIQTFIVEGGDGESARSLDLGEVARGSTPPARTPFRTDEQGVGRGARGGRIGRGSARFAGDDGAGEARLSVTHYRVLAAGQGRSLLQLRLETGRKNQIRVHMQYVRKPIVGDRRYGSQSDPIGRVCLHASELGFTNPATGQVMRFTSPAPPAFYRLVGMTPPSASEEASASRTGGEAAAAPAVAAGRPAADTSWDNVAEWYDAMIEDEKSDHFQQVIMPGALRLLLGTSEPAEVTGMRVLDVACGQGAMCRRLAQLGVEAVGVDASPQLIESAKRRTRDAGLNVRFEVGDARKLEDLRDVLGGSEHASTEEQPFNAVISIMALMNLDPLEPVLRGAASLLKPGGAFVAVILHPAFRSPRETSWGWEEEGGDAKSSEWRPDDRRTEGRFGNRRQPAMRGGPGEHPRSGRPPARVQQFRRIHGYLSAGQTAITMNPGYAAHGAEEIRTWTFHRPLQTYVRALREAGFVIEGLEEWPSLRISQPGPRAAEENRIRREIPMFLGLRAVKGEIRPR